RFPAGKTRKTAIDDSAAYESSKETRSGLTNHAPVASSGGVGAVRRRRGPGGRARMLSFVAVLALFATGAGNSAPGFAAPLASRFLSSLRLGRTADAATATDVAPELAASVAAAQATVGTVPTTDPAAVPAAP